MRTIIVVSYDDENPDDIANLYSEDLVVEPYISLYKKDVPKKKKMHLSLLKTLLTSSKDLKLSERQCEAYKDLYWSIKDMSDEDYMLSITYGCTYDDEGNAISTKNPNAHYKWPKCYQHKLDNNEGEAEFSNPFHLKDGTVAYRAKLNDIDWSREHENKDACKLYEAAWELCVEDREPNNEQEKRIKDNMSNRLEYFSQFKNKEAYVKHSTSFFMYGIATSKDYNEVNYQISDIDWVATFYDKYIKKLKGNPTLSIYEIRLLED